MSPDPDLCVPGRRILLPQEPCMWFIKAGLENNDLFFSLFDILFRNLAIVSLATILCKGMLTQEGAM